MKKYYKEVIIIALQVSMIIFWSIMQGNLYWDSFFSFERTQYLSASTEGEHYVLEDSKYSLNEWINAGYIKNMLVVDKEHSILNDGFSYIFQKFMKNPYWVMLNIAEAVFTPGVLSKWPAIVLNVVFFILLQIVIWKIAYLLTGKREQAFWTIVLYGFSGMALSMATQVRFYVLSALLLNLFVLLHIWIWNQDYRKWYKILLLEAVAMLFAKWSMTISQLTLFFYVLFIAAFVLGLFWEKRVRDALVYLAPVVCGGVAFFSVNYEYINILTHLSDVEVTGKTLWIVDNIRTLGPVAAIDRLAHMFLCIGKYAYGYWPVFFIVCVMALTLIIKDRKLSFIGSTIEMVVFVTLIAFLLIAAELMFWVQTRYSSYVFPQIAWITVVILFAFVERFPKVKWVKFLQVLIVASVVISTVSGQRIDFLYLADKEPLHRIKANTGEYVVAMQSGLLDMDSLLLYEVAANVDEKTDILPVKDLQAVSSKLPDEFVIVTPRDNDRSDEFMALGYEYSWVEETYCNNFYSMSKR